MRRPEGRARTSRLKELETLALRTGQTQQFIETPYRNERMFEALRTVCAPTTRLCVARDLSLDSEWIATRTVAAWRKSAAPELARHPTVFLILAG